MEDDGGECCSYGGEGSGTRGDVNVNMVGEDVASGDVGCRDDGSGGDKVNGGGNDGGGGNIVKKHIKDSCC